MSLSGKVAVVTAGISGGEHSDRVNPRAEQQLAELAEGEVKTALDALVRMTDEDWRRMLSVHLDGTFYRTRAAARSMAPRGAGVTEPLIDVVRMQTPQGRLGRPEEVAATIAFLCSGESSFFVGETVSPNGGMVTV